MVESGLVASVTREWSSAGLLLPSPPLTAPQAAEHRPCVGHQCVLRPAVAGTPAVFAVT